jgi:glyoxylase-like metal-dependent hydrolase (beta-lactamase superfamily II)
VQLLDLEHLGRKRVIGSYLLAGDEPALMDCGPASCLDALRAGLAAHGVGRGELRHLVLTHIHLDHAGAAGSLVRENPELLVHVSEIGAPHVVDPTRLERSARRLYGDDFDRLWGPLLPVPEENVRVIGDRVLDLEAFPTPGHASHHVSFLAADGSCFTGDAAGVRIPPGRYIAPVAPPPDIDVEAWERSVESIAAREPETLALTHFGTAPAAQLDAVREALRWQADLAASGDQDAFMAALHERIVDSAPDEVAAIEQAAPLDHLFLGLDRWHSKRG